MQKMELTRDVNNNRGAVRRDAPADNEKQQAGQKLLHLDSGGQLGRLAKEFGGEVLGVIMSVLAGELGSDTQSEVAETENYA